MLEKNPQVSPEPETCEAKRTPTGSTGLTRSDPEQGGTVGYMTRRSFDDDGYDDDNRCGHEVERR